VKIKSKAFFRTAEVAQVASQTWQTHIYNAGDIVEMGPTNTENPLNIYPIGFPQNIHIWSIYIYMYLLDGQVINRAVESRSRQAASVAPFYLIYKYNI